MGNKEIGPSRPVFIIAEAGVNHNNNLKIAFQMVDEAVTAGADAIKFQTFIAKEIQLVQAIKPAYQNKIKNKNYFQIIKELEPNTDDQIKIKNYCKKRKIIFLSTPYDKKSVDFLYTVNVPAFKIASSDLTNHLLLEYILKKGKPIILSTGLSSIKEVDLAIKLVKKFDMLNKLILMQTTSDYPISDDQVNLRVLQEYSKRYNVITGFSDHTVTHTASLGAVALGAKVVEKHFTLNKNLPGPDQAASLEPKELREWIRKIREMERLMGTPKKVVTLSEKRNLSMRKILVIKSAKKGTKITKDMLGAMRGNRNGILPLQDNVNLIVGKRLSVNIDTITQFSWTMIK